MTAFCNSGRTATGAGQRPSGAKSRSIRVGFVTTSFPVADNPASGAFIATLAEHLGRRVDLRILTPAATSPEMPPADRPFDVRYFRYAPLGWQKLAQRPGGIPAALREDSRLRILLPSFLTALFSGCARLAGECDVIHANWSINGAIAGLAAGLRGTPVVTTLRGSDIARVERSGMDRALLKSCLRTSAGLVCVSDAIRERVLELAPQRSEKVAVIYNGVDERFLSIERGSRSPQTPFRIVSVGSLIPRKAMHVLIDALRIAGRATEATVCIVGDGPERERLQASIGAAGLAQRVRLMGTVPPAALREHLENADAFVLTSRYEGRPNAVLEAMASGLPVLATRIPGTTELVHDGVNGLLFERDDANALAECLLRLERDPALRAKLGAAARDFVLESKLRWDETANAYVELYRAISGRG